MCRTIAYSYGLGRLGKDWDLHAFFFKVASKETYTLEFWQLPQVVSKFFFVKFTNIEWKASWGFSLSDITSSL